MTDLVWYLAYGSNRSADRLRAYLEGADPDHPYGAHRGSADPTPPRADRWITLDRAVTFRGRSRRWGGGVAFLDLTPTSGTSVPARAWLLDADQLAGLAAQEARLATPPAPADLLAVAPGGTLALGGGWYDTVLRLADIDGRPALTVTTAQDLPLADPTPAYLTVLAAGLSERDADGAAGPGG